MPNAWGDEGKPGKDDKDGKKDKEAKAKDGY